MAMASSKIDSQLHALFGSVRPTRWITRERPKIDRIACPWLIQRFIDPEAEILFAPTPEVLDQAQRLQAVAFDLPGAPITHRGELCSFDAFVEDFGLGDDPGLRILAPIVRGADTDRHDLAPEAAGLHAVSLGLSLLFEDDHIMLGHGMTVYDALYAWAVRGQHERHAWTPGSAAQPGHSAPPLN
jgi:hypothetical protein